MSGDKAGSSWGAVKLRESIFQSVLLRQDVGNKRGYGLG